MASDELDVELRSVVDRFGYDRVYGALGRLGRGRRPGGSRPRASSSHRRSASKKRRPRPTASEYVVKMEVAEDRRQWLSEVAEQFDTKSFLPTSSDVRRFCGIYGVPAPGSMARGSAIPRVFRFIGTMDRDEVSEMLDSGMFSGPAQLGPIADAIREAGRARRSVPRTRQ